MPKRENMPSDEGQVCEERIVIEIQIGVLKEKRENEEAIVSDPIVKTVRMSAESDVVQTFGAEAAIVMGTKAQTELCAAVEVVIEQKPPSDDRIDGETMRLAARAVNVGDRTFAEIQIEGEIDPKLVVVEIRIVVEEPR